MRSNLVEERRGIRILGTIALESGQLKNLLHGLVSVRLLWRHVRVVQRVFKADAAVVALQAA